MSEPNDPTQPPPPPVPPSQPSQPLQQQAPQANAYAAAAPAPYQAAPQVNPYGGAQAFPGSKAYVEQQFGPIAGFGSRAGALIIDVLLSLIGLIPTFTGIGLLIAGFPETTVDEYGYSQTVDGTSNGGLLAGGGVLIFLGFAISIAIQIWNRIFKMGRTGQSVGKKAMGITLINEQTGQPIGALQSFLRELLSGVINQVFYISYLWMLWDDNKQTLHDKVVHSTVIQVPKS
ncbi:proline rich antigenic protein [Janibacter sp. HTCC2649]|uniref:RDD family protein n=1 Tax=Janibacter sp. HTCC2649 TaxID=313589 RepID=UPI00006711AC|nr:RDD family protein [Janibacter sp. HTCC2649]EAP97092.1 proline rich antigenic protein [Janibacter sp. HTCC2649]